MDNFNEELGLRVPEHVAIILDGNGRWAKLHHVPRNMGHAAGSKIIEQVCEDSYLLGIKYLTVYAFSTENWKRSQEEVSALMMLFSSYLKDCIKKAPAKNMRVKIIGKTNELSPELIKLIDELENVTQDCTGLTFLIAVNYGGRDEIVRSVKAIGEKLLSGEISLESIDEELISNHLDTEGIPDPDLIIRTSGEQRLSNFLTWQSSYSEFYFPKVLWPDFNKSELIKAIEKYNSRERRFGGRKEE